MLIIYFYTLMHMHEYNLCVTLQRDQCIMDMAEINVQFESATYEVQVEGVQPCTVYMTTFGYIVLLLSK